MVNLGKEFRGDQVLSCRSLCGALPVSADDILFVPSSRTKAFLTASSIVASTTATAAIYRVF
jgi:hypothetical protein